MPFINVKTNTPVSEDKETALKSALGEAISIIPGKSESWLMVEIEPERKLYFKGSDAPAAMVSVSVCGSADSASFNKLTDASAPSLTANLVLIPQEHTLSTKQQKTGAGTDLIFNEEKSKT